jgi:hypothetical protein
MARATTARVSGLQRARAIEHHFRLIARGLLEVLQAPAHRVDVTLQPRHTLPRRHRESESAKSLGLSGSRQVWIVEPRHDPGLEPHRTAQILEQWNARDARGEIQQCITERCFQRRCARKLMGYEFKRSRPLATQCLARLREFGGLDRPPFAVP